MINLTLMLELKTMRVEFIKQSVVRTDYGLIADVWYYRWVDGSIKKVYGPWRREEL